MDLGRDQLGSSGHDQFGPGDEDNLDRLPGWKDTGRLSLAEDFSSRRGMESTGALVSFNPFERWCWEWSAIGLGR